MMKIILAIASVWLAVAASASVHDEPRFPTDKITLEQWQVYFQEIKSLPGAQIKESANQVTVSFSDSATGTTIYAFTAPANPAYPAVIRRHLRFKEGDGWYIDRKVHYVGDINIFARWWQSFDALDEAVRRDMNKG